MAEKLKPTEITARDREKHASGIYRVIPLCPIQDYISLASYIVECEVASRNETIEECAKIASELGCSWTDDKIREWAADRGRLDHDEAFAFFHADQIAIAIRALKEE